MQEYDYYESSDARKYGIGMLIGISLFVLVCCVGLYIGHNHGLPGGLLYAMLGVLGLIYLLLVSRSLFLIVRDGYWVFAIRDGTLIFLSPDKGLQFSLPVAEIASLRQRSKRDSSGLTQLYVIGADGREYEITERGQLNWDLLFAKLRDLNPSIRKEHITI